MNYQELRQIIEENRFKCGGKFNVDGKEMRLFVSSLGQIAEFDKKSRTRGHLVNYSQWVSVTPCLPKSSDKVAILKRNAGRIAKYLTDSGLWKGILEDCIAIVKMSDETIREYFADNGEIRWNDNPLGLQHTAAYVLSEMCEKDFIKTVPYSGCIYTEDTTKEMLNNGILTSQAIRWRGSYDYTISVNNNDKRAWFSAEYKDCGNGHYYLLLDGKHIAFREDD